MGISIKTRAATAAGLGGIALAATTALAAPAQAFSNPSLPEARVKLSNCKVVSGTLNAFRSGAGCKMNDAYDNTFFQNDAGGYGAKLEVRKNGLRAKVEFHPYGDDLYVYDTAADGDTIYVRVSWAGNPNPRRTIKATSTGGPNGKSDPFSLGNIPEGRAVNVHVYDDASWQTDNHGNPVLVPYNLLDSVKGTA